MQRTQSMPTENESKRIQILFPIWSFICYLFENFFLRISSEPFFFHSFFPYCEEKFVNFSERLLCGLILRASCWAFLQFFFMFLNTGAGIDWVIWVYHLNLLLYPTDFSLIFVLRNSTSWCTFVHCYRIRGKK